MSWESAAVQTPTPLLIHRSVLEQPTVSFSKENGFLSTVLEFQKLYLYLSNGFVKSSPFLGFVIANGL